MEKATHILTAIVRKASQGDNAARGELYARFSQKMFSICVRMTGNRNDAEDVLQDAFVTAFNHLAQLKDLQLFEPWLRSIVVNACIRFAKRTFSVCSFDEQYADVAEADDANWMQALSFEHIHEAIRNLPDGCREVFNLYVLEDHTHQKIAAALNISVSTSKSQYHRARLLLKEQLRKRFIQYG